MMPPVDHDELPENGDWPVVKDVTLGCILSAALIGVMILATFLIGLLRG